MQRHILRNKEKKFSTYKSNVEDQKLYSKIDIRKNSNNYYIRRKVIDLHLQYFKMLPELYRSKSILSFSQNKNKKRIILSS